MLANRAMLAQVAGRLQGYPDIRDWPDGQSWPRAGTIWSEDKPNAILRARSISDGPAGKLRPAYDFLLTAVLTYGFDIAMALLIVAIGWWLSNRVANTVKRALGRTNADATLHARLASLVLWAIRVVAIVAALGNSASRRRAS